MLTIAGIPLGVEELKGNGAETLPDKREAANPPANPPKEPDRVFTPAFGNHVNIDPDTIAGNLIILCAILVGELEHQLTRTRTDDEGDPVPDPPGTPDPKTEAENGLEYGMSERRAGKAALALLQWYVPCASALPPAGVGPLNPADAASLARMIDHAQRHIRRFGG